MGESKERTKFLDALTEAQYHSILLGTHIGIFQGITHVIVGGVVGSILFYGGGMVGRGEISSGGLMTFLVTTQNAQRALTALGTVSGQMNRALSSVCRVLEYMNISPTISLNRGYVPVHGFQGT